MEEPRRGGRKKRQKKKTIAIELAHPRVTHFSDRVCILTPNVHMLLGETITTGKGRESALACWE